MQLMSIDDLAAYLGDSKRTIYKYIASGDCPPYMRISSKNIKFDRADVDAWLESKKVNPEKGGKKMSEISFVDRAKVTVRNIIVKSPLPWTPRAQAVLKRAQKQARKDGFDLVGTEHILFGIVSVEDCIGAKVLENLGIEQSTCYQSYEKLLKPSDEKVKGKAKLSDDVNKVIQCAYEQVTQWGHAYIGAEHLLAGILLSGEGNGFKILADLGVTLEKAREETAKLIVCRSTDSM
ncbi:MAG: helix-turn-helix domain-containing protein [Planctomycetes bacterium]|nr:helix-turn-helix domain-containing protein [Planctomycetota bacterium]MBL7146836.1 helix-turn-helix domain-containing protein [Phycisphaerae bacterium]